MEEYLWAALLFSAGLLIGWLNPIEGPLDWTYDEYASQPAHKAPTRVVPIKKEKPLFLWFFDEEEELEENNDGIKDLQGEELEE